MLKKRFIAVSLVFLFVVYGCGQNEQETIDQQTNGCCQVFLEGGGLRCFDNSVQQFCERAASYKFNPSLSCDSVQECESALPNTLTPETKQTTTTQEQFVTQEVFTTQQAQTLTISIVEDTYIIADDSNPHGTEKKLYACNGCVVDNKDIIIYLKTDNIPSSVFPITSAKLFIKTVSDPAAPSDSDQEIRQVLDTSWTEVAINGQNYLNWPYEQTVIDTKAINAKGTFFGFNVTNAITDPGQYTFALTGTTDNDAVYRSSEGDKLNEHPYLEITYSEQTTSTTSTSTSTTIDNTTTTSSTTTIDNTTTTIEQTTKPVINASYYDGETTNFTDPSFNPASESNLVLEKTSVGIIKFNETIVFTQDRDLALYTDISANKVSIDTEAIPEFNVSANITLYGVDLNNPRILRNGQPCSPDICVILENNVDLTFFVKHFTEYSAEEIPTSTPNDGENGVGNGGSSGGTTSLDTTTSLSTTTTATTIPTSTSSIQVQKTQTKIEEFGIPIYVIVIIVVLLVLLVNVGIFYVHRHPDVLDKIKYTLDNISTKITSKFSKSEQVQKGSVIKTSDINILKKYVRLSLKQGYTKEQIIEVAKRQGWPDDKIAEAVFGL